MRNARTERAKKLYHPETTIIYIIIECFDLHKEVLAARNPQNRKSEEDR